MNEANVRVIRSLLDQAEVDRKDVCEYLGKCGFAVLGKDNMSSARKGDDIVYIDWEASPPKIVVTKIDNLSNTEVGYAHPLMPVHYIPGFGHSEVELNIRPSTVFITQRSNETLYAVLFAHHVWVPSLTREEVQVMINSQADPSTVLVVDMSLLKTPAATTTYSF